MRKFCCAPSFFSSVCMFALIIFAPHAHHCVCAWLLSVCCCCHHCLKAFISPTSFDSSVADACSFSFFISLNACQWAFCRKISKWTNIAIHPSFGFYAVISVSSCVLLYSFLIFNLAHLFCTCRELKWLHFNVKFNAPIQRRFNVMSTKWAKSLVILYNNQSK